MFDRNDSLNMSVFEYLFWIGYAVIIVVGVFATSQFAYEDWWGRTNTLMTGIGLLLMAIGFTFYSSISKRTFLLGILLVILCAFIYIESHRGKDVAAFVAVAFLGGMLDWRKSIRVFFVVSSASVIMVLILYATGVFYPEYIGRTGEDTVRHYLGFTYSAIPANFYFHIVIAYLFLKRQTINLAETIVIMATNWLLYVYTDTNAVFFLITALVGVLWIYRCFPQIFRLKYLKVISIWVVPISALLIIGLSYFYTPMNSTFLQLDHLLNNRLSLGYKAIEQYGIHLFGHDVSWVYYTGRYGTNVYEEYFFIDSSYLNILLTFGLIMLVLICVGYMMTGKKLYEEKHYMGCIIFIVFALHCATDHHLFEVRYNPFIVLLGFVFINRGLILKRGYNTMEHNNINKDREISIRSLFARVMRKWWIILIAAVAVGVLAGGYKMYKTSNEMKNNSEDTMTYEEYQKKLADYQQNTKTLKESIAASEDTLQAKINYLANSIIARINPAEVHTAKNNYFFASDDGDSNALRDRAANRAVDLYNTYITSLDFWSDMSKEMDTEPQYLLELVSTTPDYEASSLLVSVRYTDDEGAKKLADYMNTKLNAYYDTAQGEIGSFRVTPATPVISQNVDSTLQNWHFNKTSEIKNLENSIKQLQQSLDSLSRPSQPATASRSALVKDSVSFGIKAAIGGAVAAIIILAIIIVATKKVLSEREFNDRYDFRKIARFPKRGTGPDGLTDRERYDIAVENINKYSDNSGNILVVGNAPKTFINTAIAELRKRMGNVKIDYVENLNDSTAHVNRFKEADGVIITETIGKSRYNRIDNTVQYVYDWDKPIIGTILY